MLFAARPGLSLLAYDSVQSARQSDHKPVLASFLAPFDPGPRGSPRRDDDDDDGDATDTSATRRWRRLKAQEAAQRPLKDMHAVATAAGSDGSAVCAVQ